MALKRRIAVLGSTGSVGVSTLALVEEAQVSGALDVEVTALASAGRNLPLLIEQVRRWRPAVVAVADPDCAERLRAETGLERVLTGPHAAEEAALAADWVMCAIVGAAGLRSTMAAARNGAVVALANKESLVCAGPLLMQASRASGGAVVPVDSEHSAIFQALHGRPPRDDDRLVLTASGGPFLRWSKAQMAEAGPAQAVKHPKWSMGAKISVDSATLMNKGLELIEASYLFGVPEDRIDVLVHPQSIIHSMVQHADGSTLAQLGEPDMRTPIAVALSWPDRLPWNAPRVDLAAHGSLTFEAPDAERFPALKLARDALRAGGSAPAVLNAANEVAVATFLSGDLRFLDIAAIVAETLQRVRDPAHQDAASDDPLALALQADAEARRTAREIVRTRAHA